MYFTTDILRYSVSLDTLEKVSSLSGPTSGGLALQGKDGKTIYYFGGNSFTTTVHKFDSLTNVTVKLATRLPSPVLFAGGVSMNNGTMFIFDGRSGKTMEFLEETETARIIGDLNFYSGSSNVLSTTAIPNGKDGVWLFAGNGVKPTYPILRFNTSSPNFYFTPGNAIPTLYYLPASVYDGKNNNGYLIGGLGRAVASDGSTHQSNGILK
jgi:hypothetical protein